MYIFSIVLFLSIFATSFARPVKRDTTTDIQVLAFANVLEQLESAFYTQALNKFNTSSFEAAGFASTQLPIQQIQTIANDENIHTVTLQSAINTLGGQIVSNCTFNFSSALTDVNTMVATARVVENVGVSAYLGVLSLLSDPALVTAAGSIMTVEARHQAILNILSNATSIPQPFDVALAPADVLAIVNPFISGCKLGISANPPLTITNSGTLQAGTKLNFGSPALTQNQTTSQLSCEFVTGASNASIYQPLDGCTVPANVTGPMYVFITKDQTGKNSSSHTHGAKNANMIVAGPALLFINEPDFIGELVRPGLGGSGAGTTGNPATVSPIPTATMPSALPSVASSATSSVSASLPSPTSAAPPTAIPSAGSYTTTLSPAQASAILASLAN